MVVSCMSTDHQPRYHAPRQLSARFEVLHAAIWLHCLCGLASKRQAAGSMSNKAPRFRRRHWQATSQKAAYSWWGWGRRRRRWRRSAKIRAAEGCRSDYNVAMPEPSNTPDV
jgi:hypothetical protein